MMCMLYWLLRLGTPAKSIPSLILNILISYPRRQVNARFERYSPIFDSIHVSSSDTCHYNVIDVHSVDFCSFL